MFARAGIVAAILFCFISAIAQSSPVISSTSPTVGPVSPVGSSVTIQGSGFGVTQNGNTVTFAGIAATPGSWSDTQIVVPVPSSLPTGSADVVVTVNGTASNARSFLVIPVITNVSANPATVGTPITLTGTSLGDQQGSSTVTFNGLTATPTSWSNTSITVPVPLGASNGFLIVTVNGFAYNVGTFYILPSISQFQPSSVPVGAQVTILGSGFGTSQGFGGVTFNGVSATVQPQNWTDTTIVTTVPAGATTGPVVVTSASLFSSTGANFGVGPALVSLTVAPVNPVMVLKGSQQFTATGLLSDGTLSDYTATAAWSSSNSSVVSASNGGLAQALALGTANITATVGGIVGTTTVTVQAAPTITALSISSGAPGATVAITGSGFGSTQGPNGGVALNDILATVVSWSDTTISAIVPPGATSGNIVVIANGQASNPFAFTVAISSVLSGQYGQTVTAITLSSPLVLDWQHWGTTDNLPTVSEGVVSPILNGYVVIGPNNPSRLTNGEIEYSWTDGDNPSSMDRTTTGVLVTGTGNGFELSVPVTTVPQTLTLYVGAWEAQGQLTASLSDNSVPNYTDSSVDIVPANGDHHVNGTYAITFQASQPGQSLKVDYVLAVDHGAANGLAGYVSLQSAVLTQTQPTVTLTSPLPNQTFASPSPVSLAANALQIGANISDVAFFSDGTKVFDGTRSPYTFNLTGLTPGDHTIIASATDTNGLSSTSAPILVTEVGTGGVLNASVSSPGSTTVDLSAGTSDWVHWTNVSPDRKAGVTAQISDLKTLANGSAHPDDASAQNGVNYRWVSGTPTDSQTGTATQVHMQGYENGFQLTVPADTTLRTLALYLASGLGQSTLRISLSDGSATPYVNVFATPTAFVENLYTIQFQAASTGQTLTITDQVTRDDGFAYVALESATVSDLNPPQIDSVTPATAAPGTQITITGSGFGNSQGNATVSLNAMAMNVTSWADSAITATVPLAQSGAIVVSRGLADSNGVPFTVILPPPPVISLINPSAGNAGTIVSISGSNFGAQQNNSTVTFNGLVATPTSWSDTAITVPAPQGVHSGPVVVTTASGPSNGVQFTFSPGIRFSLQPVYVTPDETSLEVDGSAAFTLVGPSGTPVTDASWSVDNTTLASITADTSTPSKGTLQALAAGEVTITATSSLGTAQAKATIYAAGATPAGTAAWGFYPQTQDFFFEATIKSFGNSNFANVPFMYLEEGNFIDTTTVSALDDAGSLQWRVKLDPIVPADTIFFPVVAAGTNDGGILVQTNEADPNGPNEATGFYRLGPDGKQIWTYSFPSVGTFDLAIGPDGTIYFWAQQGSNFPTLLIGLDDTTGTEKFRYTADGGSPTSFTSSEQPSDTRPDGIKVDANNPWLPCAAFFPAGQFNPPRPAAGVNEIVQPIVGADGSVYIPQLMESSSVNYDNCTVVKNPFTPPGDPPTYLIQSMSGQIQFNQSFNLFRISPSGAVATVPFGTVSFSGQAAMSTSGETFQWTYNGGASRLPSIGPVEGVVPHPDGGVLVNWGQGSSTPGDNHLFLTTVQNDSQVTTNPFNGDIFGNMAINDQGTVFFDGFGTSVSAVDIANGNLKWSVPGKLVAATDDGGALINNAGSIQSVDQNGVLGTDSLPIGASAIYMAAGSFLQDPSFGSVQLVQTSSSQLTGFLAEPWAITPVANPQQTYRASPQQGTLYLRSFAPWPWFGNEAPVMPCFANCFKGDNRTFSTSTDPSITSRLNAIVKFSLPEMNEVARKAYSDPSFDVFHRTATQHPKLVLTAGSGKMHIEISGSDPLFPGSPDINTKLDISVQMNGSNACYSGHLFGDAFPDSEAFVINSQKQTASLITFHTTGTPNLGPIEFLPGNNNRDMGSFVNVCLPK